MSSLKNQMFNSYLASIVYGNEYKLEYIVSTGKVLIF